MWGTDHSLLPYLQFPSFLADASIDAFVGATMSWPQPSTTWWHRRSHQRRRSQRKKVAGEKEETY